MTVRARRLARVLFVLAVAAATPIAVAAAGEPSASDIETARTAFKEGLELRDKKADLAGALEKFKAAHKLIGTPRTGYELGKTYMMMGRLVEAREVFLQVEHMPIKPDESPEAKKSRKESTDLAASLDQRIPQLKVIVKGVPAGLTPIVTVDGENVPFEALVVPRRVNPGAHVVLVKVTGAVDQSQSVDLKEGETREVAIAIPASAMATPTPTPPPAPTSGEPTDPAPVTAPPGATPESPKESEPQNGPLRASFVSFAACASDIHGPVLVGWCSRGDILALVNIGVLGFYSSSDGDVVTLAQLALYGSHAGAFTGIAQAGAYNDVGKSFYGLGQAAVYNHVGKNFNGAAQWGGLNVVGGDFYGVTQWGLYNSVGGDLLGIQAGGYSRTDGKLGGLQVGLMNTVGHLQGLQVGLINLATRVDGLQVGGFNSADLLYGIQIGLWNRNGAGISLPVINAGW